MQLSKHILVKFEEAGARVVIGPRRSILQVAVGLMGSIVLGTPWAAWLATTGLHLPPDWPLPVSIIFLVAWSLGTGVWIWQFLWNLFGREDLLITATTITHHWTLLFIERTESFALAKVAAIRLHERRVKGGIRRYIAFDYDGRVVRATSQITEEEGRALLEGPLRRPTGR
jgi:hypothetical protein